MHNANYLACGFISESEIMGEIIFTECIIIGQQIFNTFITLSWNLFGYF